MKPFRTALKKGYSGNCIKDVKLKPIKKLIYIEFEVPVVRFSKTNFFAYSSGFAYFWLRVSVSKERLKIVALL